MGKKSWVDKDHYRVTSDDGSTSWLMKSDSSLFGSDTCVEQAHHRSDGKTDAYEYNGFSWSGRGNKK